MKRLIRASQDIFAMSVSRDDGIATLKANKQPILLHLMKVCIYQDSTDNLDHWIHELGSFVSRINNVTLKPNNRKFPAHIYRKEIFSILGNTETDIDNMLGTFWSNNIETDKYPDFEITDDMVATAYLFLHAISDWFISVWSTRNTLSAAVFRAEIRRFIKQYYNI